MNIGANVQITEDDELLMSDGTVLIFDGLGILLRLVGGTNDIDERLDSESEDVCVCNEREGRKVRDGLVELGTEAAAAAAVAAATAVFIARGIRILNGDIGGADAEAGSVGEVGDSTLGGGVDGRTLDLVLGTLVT